MSNDKFKDMETDVLHALLADINAKRDALRLQAKELSDEISYRVRGIRRKELLESLKELPVDEQNEIKAQLGIIH